MKKIVCLHCGGTIEIDQSGKRGKCKFCQNVWDLVEALDDATFVKLQTAMEYQTTFRFTDAVRLYKTITEEKDDLIEAWWGAFLSEYGIEFGTNRYGESVPTCHRVHTESVFRNEYYKKALSLAQGENKERYATLGERIEEVRKGIIEKVEDGENYDVFICFKATEIGDETRKTRDYDLGMSIYEHLTKRGYKVFFSAKTLNRIKETEFEPYIFKALSTAKVMLLLCSSNEKIDSAWVKNEWGRYLDMHNGKGLVPICGNAYERYSPTQLPNDLQKLNAIAFDENIFDNMDSKVDAYFEDRIKQSQAEKEQEIFKKALEQAKKEMEAFYQAQAKSESARIQVEERKPPVKEQVKPSVSPTQQGKTGRLVLDDGVYEGGVLNGVPHGKGKYTYNNGNVFEGEFVNGKRMGMGVLKVKDGGELSGQFVNGRIHGKGKDILKSGDVYVGEFKDGERNGKGTYTFKSGSVYVGEFIDGKINGRGEFKYAIGDSYKGEFVNEKRHGYGVYTYKSGRKEEGLWENDKFIKVERRQSSSSMNVDVEAFKRKVFSNGVYFGQLNSDKPYGYGKFDYNDGAKCVGDWVNGRREGKCKIEHTNGDVYRGDFRAENRNGCGIYTYANGNKYMGDFVGGMFSGKGIYLFNSGEAFVGNFNKNKYNGGVGRWFNKKWQIKQQGFYNEGNLVTKYKPTIEKKKYDNGSYEGEFYNGKRHGYGRYVYNSGHEYEGEWADGVIHGVGKYKYNNGEYIGFFANGKRNGVGKYTFNSGGLYEGDFKDDKFNGYGKRVFASGDVYEGGFVNDKIEGYGTYTFKNGNVYFGAYKNGKRNGYGKFVFADGDVYEGNYKEDKRNGFGTYRYKNGDIYVGEWKDGDRTGHGKYTYKNGVVQEGYFENNKFIR